MGDGPEIVSVMPVDRIGTRIASTRALLVATLVCLVTASPAWPCKCLRESPETAFDVLRKSAHVMHVRVERQTPGTWSKTIARVLRIYKGEPVPDTIVIGYRSSCDYGLNTWAGQEWLVMPEEISEGTFALPMCNGTRNLSVQDGAIVGLFGEAERTSLSVLSVLDF